MAKFLLALAALTVGTLLGTEPGRAYNDAPWCAIVEVGEGSVREICHFRSIESCQQEVISGNRGTCSPNPSWSNAQREWRPAKRKAGSKRHHRL